MANKNNDVKLHSKSAQIALESTIVYVVVIFFAILAIIPFLYMFMNAMWDSSYIQSHLVLYPKLDGFKTLKANYDFLESKKLFDFVTGFKNSIIISGSSTILTVYFSALTAYGLTVYDFKGKKTIFALIVGVMMVPTAVNITGFYNLMNKMGLIGTKWPLIIPAIAAPSTVFFIKQYLDSSLSVEIIEASRIDGAGEFFTFNKICLPIMVPAIATQAIFSFLGSWNNFFAPSILLTRAEQKTLPLMVSLLSSDQIVNYGALYLGLSISVVPVIIAYIFLQRFIISGVAAGGVKE